MSNHQAPHSRLPKLNGIGHAPSPKMTIVKLALTQQDVTVITHTLRQTIDATRLVMNETPWPAPVKMARKLEIEAMEQTLTTIVDQTKISGG